jgi:hypothetical protein
MFSFSTVSIVDISWLSVCFMSVGSFLVLSITSFKSCMDFLISAKSLLLLVLNFSLLLSSLSILLFAIRVQGTKYIMFVQKHFPVLKMILQKVLDDGVPVPKTEDKSVLPSALTRQESDDPSSHSDTEHRGRT